MFKAKAAFNGFSVDDLAKARAFYGETLGLQVDNEGVGLRLHLPGGGTVFAYPKEDHQPATFTFLNFVVASIDEAVDELTNRGVQFEHYEEGPKTDEQGIFRGTSKNQGPDIAWFKDPAGNAVGLGDTQGMPLVEMEQESFALPVMNAIATHFLTATAAARHMRKNGSGVILAITASAVMGYPNVGGFGVACAAIEGFCRQLAAEAGPQGIRVVCLRSAGSPDAPGVDEVFRLHAKNAGIPWEAFEATMGERTLLKRLPKLAEVANTAVLMASDYASAITGAVANVTCGEIVD